MLAVLSAATRPCSSLFRLPSPRYLAMRQRRLSIPCAETLSVAETDERTVQIIPSQTSTFLNKRISHELRHHGGHRCSDWSTFAIRPFHVSTLRRSILVGIELRRAGCRWRVTNPALLIASWVLISTMATFSKAPL